MIDNRLMDFAKMPYEAPSVTSLDILSEGLLCGSFGDANEAGKTLEESDGSSWDF